MKDEMILRDAQAGKWLWFRQPVSILHAWRHADVLPAIRSATAAVEDEGLYAAGFLTYEAAPAFDLAMRVHASGPLPLLWLGLYRPPAALDHLPDPISDACEFEEWRPSVTWQEYERAVARVQERIARGDTYQANYTFRLDSRFRGDPWALFRRLLRAQRAPYAAYLDIGSHVICSASPELFFDLDGDRIISRPMKGTTGRGRWLAEDEARARWLHGSEKNRAENVMIVDMIRNDLGRVAELGSVQAPHLFEVERYPTVWQMTSTVVARTREPLADILSALFPCASITGAPKVSTMRILAGLENRPRGVYTGSIGYLAPGRRAQFNVAIRTLVLDKASGQVEYGVGGGVVWDSQAADEYRECQLKARVLSHDPPVFSLLESLLWTPDRGCWLLNRHLQRLLDSAAYFGFPVHAERVRQELDCLVAGLPERPHKVRLLLAEDGAIHAEAAALDLAAVARPLRLALASTPVDSADPFLFHKTTHRAVYERALASHPDCDDVLLWNERGELTESTRANIVLRLAGELLTPPVDSGLLAGTFRAELLAQGVIREQVLHISDLAHAESVHLINSVREWMEVTW